MSENYLIYELTIENAWRFGDVIEGMHRLRKSIFYDKQKWRDIPVVRDMEFDQFDTMRARYLVGIDQEGKVRAVCRNLFCSDPWMLKTLWADQLAPGADLPSDNSWAEGTRMAVDQSLPFEEFMKWQGAMSCAGSEWALRYGVKNYTFVTYVELAKHLEKTFDITYWGPPVEWPDGTFIAGYWKIDEALLAKQRKITGISKPMLVPVEQSRKMERVRQAVA